jgi:hypothetical protein
MANGRCLAAAVLVMAICSPAVTIEADYTALIVYKADIT